MAISLLDEKGFEPQVRERALRTKACFEHRAKRFSQSVIPPSPPFKLTIL